MITFVLFVNFLLRAIDRFLGKGLDLLTILEYLFLNLAWILALSVPMAVLLATLMTFGRLSEDNEINAMRASGISFITIMRAPILFGVIITTVLIYFNNFILPEMNFKARLLSGDIYRKRPDMSIEPGIFLDNLPDYSMIVGGKSIDGTMKDVRIFSKGNKEAQTSIHANSGNLNTLEDAFLLTLYDGEIHELGQKDYTNYRRIIFDKHVINIPAKDLLLNRRDSTNRSDREMTVPMIQNKINSYEKRLKIVNKRLSGNFYRTIGDSVIPNTTAEGKIMIANALDKIKNQNSLSKAQRIKKEKRIKNLERQLNNEFNLIKSYKKSQNKYGVEIHKKFSIPVACILFVLLGAPLGVMSKKGGFAISTGLSFGFFLIYYVLLIGGEEMADRNFLSPAIGMWSPNLIILLIAIYLLIHTVRENAPIGISLPTIFKKKKNNQ
jgi:lipopolysaccharide export system permease protein